MKTYIYYFLLASVLFLSCTDNGLEELELRNENKIENIDPVKDCPENDRNCNGVDDDEE